MRKLKEGELVYNKAYGQGIVFNFLITSNKYKVIFVNHKTAKDLERDELFAVGDEINYSTSPTKFCMRDQKGFFRGFVPFSSKPQIYISHAIHTVTFAVYDITHIKEEPSIEITVKINGKETQLSDISEETLLRIRNETFN